MEPPYRSPFDDAASSTGRGSRSHWSISAWVSRHYARALYRLLGRPRTVLVAALAVGVLSAFLVARNRLDPDIASLFPRQDPTLRLTRHLQGDWPPTKVLLVVLRSEDPKTLEEAIPRVVEGLTRSPFLDRIVATRKEFAGARYDWIRQAPLYFFPDETLDRLKERLTGPERQKEIQSSLRSLAEDPIAAKSIVTRDPLGVRWLFDEGAGLMSNRMPVRLQPGSPYVQLEKPHVALIRARGKEDSFNVAFSQTLVKDVQTRLSSSLGEAGVRMELAGGYVTADFQSRVMRRDMILQSVVSAVLVLGFLAWFSRSWLAPHLLLFPVALAILCALAIGGIVLGPLTPLVVSAAAILIAQGIDFSVHLFSRFRSERRDLGPKDAMVRSQLSLGRPFVGAAATTMVAFLALLLSHFPGFNQFGLLLALGLTLCLIFSFTITPALLLSAKSVGKDSGRDHPRISRILSRMTCSRALVPFALVIALTGVASWVAVVNGRIRIDLDVRNSMPPGDPGQEVLGRLERDLGLSMNPIFALVDAKMPLEELSEHAEVLRRKGVVGGSDGPHTLIASRSKQARVQRFQKETEGWMDGALGDLSSAGFRPEAFREGLSDLSKLISSGPPGLTRLEEAAFSSLRSAFTLEDQGRRSWVVYLLPTRSLWGVDERKAFDRAVREELGKEVPLYSAFHLPDHYATTLSRDLLSVAGWTILGVWLLTFLVHRSFWDGAIALVPVTLSTGSTFLGFALLGGSISPMNMVAVPIILGIGVDAGIHYMSRFQERGYRDPRRTLVEVAPGIWGSLATTLLGFGSIAFSATPGLASMGVLVTMGTLACGAATFVLLPYLAAWRAKVVRGLR